MRETIFTYTKRLIRLLEGRNDFSLLVHLKCTYQTCYNHVFHGVFLSSLPIPNVGNEFSFCGNTYVISKSKINVSNLRFLVLSHVFVPWKWLVTLIPFFVPLYNRYDYLNILKYKHSISIHKMCKNGYSSKKIIRKTLLFINSCSCSHTNIVGFINSYRCSLFSAIFLFEKHYNENCYLWKGRHMDFLLHMQYIVYLLETNC